MSSEKKETMRFFLMYASVIYCFAACTSTGKSAAPKDKLSPAPILSPTLVEKQLNGADFFARGSQPSSWTLEMDFGNLVRFKSLDGTEANASAAQPVYLPEIKATRFTSAGSVEVVVYNEACKDMLSGESFSKRVTVRIKEKLYEGCGQYLFDATLHGKWLLEKINNNLVSSTDFSKGLPLLNLDLKQQTLSGHDGCNQFSGGLEVMGSKIRFNNLALTRIACPGNKPGLEFVPLLNGQTIDYYFKDGQLYFYLQDDSILIFKKA